MLLIIKRIKKAIKALFSKNVVFDLSIDEALRLAGESNIRFFVQIGSNDGKKNDPLYSYIRDRGWKGILVEPDPNNFIKLKESYNDLSGLIFENTGIAPESGTLVFYKLKQISTDEPAWYDQIGSFDEATFQKNISYIKGLDNRIEKISLPVLTFEDLMAKHRAENVDLLQLDTEGFDYRILRSIDFRKYPVRLIIFETEWMSQFELRELVAWLRNLRYQIFCSGGDHIAIRK